MIQIALNVNDACSCRSNENHAISLSSIVIPVHLATVQSILQRLYIAPAFVKDPLGSDRLFVLVFELVRTLRKLRRVVGACGGERNIENN